MDDRGDANAIFDDIELELASIRIVTDRERLDQPRAPHKRLAAGHRPQRVIDTRGININSKIGNTPAVKPEPELVSEPQPAATQPEANASSPAPRKSLAERLARVRATD